MRTTVFRITLHLLFWLALYLLPFLFSYGSISTTILFGDRPGVIHAVSTFLLVGYAYLNHYLLVPTLYLHRKFFLYIAIVITCSVAVMRFPFVFDVFGQHGPKHKPPIGPKPFRGKHPAGDLNLNYDLILFVIFTFVSISIRQQRQLLEAQKEKLAAELSFLKSQINPHFLFNTLNSIYALALRKSDDTPRAIIQLSELMRYILQGSDTDTVPLESELQFVANYITLQKRRLGNTVQIDFQAPEKAADKRIAPLILMSFVENAFKHGVNPDEDSVIRIAITLQAEQLNLFVMNNKVNSVCSGETVGIGLKNATSRLEHLYPGKHKLTIEDRDRTFTVHLTLNVHD